MLCVPEREVEVMDNHRVIALAAFVLVSVPPFITGQDSNEQHLVPATTASIADADVTPPRNIHARNPKYAREARAAGHQGTSILSFTVGTDGYTRDINVVRKLDTELDDSAIATVRKWRYKPARKGDEPVEVKIETRIRFRLCGGSSSKIAELWDRADKLDHRRNDWASRSSSRGSSK
jgi:TonB family protein